MADYYHYRQKIEKQRRRRNAVVALMVVLIILCAAAGFFWMSRPVSYTHLTLPTTSRRQRQMCIRDNHRSNAG